MSMEQSIPLKKMVLSENGGMKTIALVDKPAIMENWITFNEEKSVKFTFANEDKGIILSPLLIPGRIIPRIDKAGNPFAVVMDGDTIAEVQLRWSKELRQNFANEMHDPEKPIDGIHWFANFQSDGVNILNPPAFSHLPNETLFIMGKVTNPEIKAKIKDGTYKAVSMEGLFDLIEFETLTVEQVEAITESVLEQN